MGIYWDHYSFVEISDFEAEEKYLNIPWARIYTDKERLSIVTAWRVLSECVPVTSL